MPIKYKCMPKERKSDDASTNKTQTKKKHGDLRVIERKNLINLPGHFHKIPSNEKISSH